MNDDAYDTSSKQYVIEVYLETVFEKYRWSSTCGRIERFTKLRTEVAALLECALQAIDHNNVILVLPPSCHVAGRMYLAHADDCSELHIKGATMMVAWMWADVLYSSPAISAAANGRSEWDLTERVADPESCRKQNHFKSGVTCSLQRSHLQKEKTNLHISNQIFRHCS
ncbi:hypothetical protein SeMB42_g03307 [Synchytrium endobioticum]|uniref:Uncharacterized protein n=1 Tax=Synchytrium endobioticum TaxID=286115 RepID=A0A507D7L0_9FUNG|nr:hypothetical protein SeMB42_g03307 [Synchytrium endobioticum]